MVSDGKFNKKNVES